MNAEDLSARPPPHAAVMIVPGVVTHARMKPATHRFSYRVFNLLIDVDRLEEANRASRLFSVGRFNLMGFDPDDHAPRPGAALGDHVRGLLSDAGVTEPVERLVLWCYPRILGHAFDPLSIYFAYAGGRLRALVYAVRNTFGERHTYVAPIRPGEADASGVKQERDKLFYVSPFMGMAMRYHFRIAPPGEDLRVRILETDGDGPILSACFSGRPEPLTASAALRALRRAPLLGLKVVGGIHYEALKLWLKGVGYVRRPPPPPLHSFGPPDAADKTLNRRAA